MGRASSFPAIGDSVKPLPKISPLGSDAEGREAAKLICLALVSFLFLNQPIAFRAPESKSLSRAEQIAGKQLPASTPAGSRPAGPSLPCSRGHAARRAARRAKPSCALLCKQATHRERRTTELISVLNLPLKFIFSKLFIKSMAQLFHINLFLLADSSSARGSFSLSLGCRAADKRQEPDLSPWDTQSVEVGFIQREFAEDARKGKPSPETSVPPMPGQMGGAWVAGAQIHQPALRFGGDGLVQITLPGSSLTAAKAMHGPSHFLL